MEPIFGEIRRNTALASPEELLLPIFGNKLLKKLSRLFDLLTRKDHTNDQQREIRQHLIDLSEVVGPHRGQFPLLSQWLVDRIESLPTAPPEEDLQGAGYQTERVLPQLMSVEELHKLRSETPTRAVESVLSPGFDAVAAATVRQGDTYYDEQSAAYDEAAQQHEATDEPSTTPDKPAEETPAE